MITSLNSAYAAFDPRFQELERTVAAAQNAQNAQNAQTGGVQNTADTVTLRTPHLLTDEEAEAAMASVRQATQTTPTEALGLHQGLNYDRVMKLLEGL